MKTFIKSAVVAVALTAGVGGIALAEEEPATSAPQGAAAAPEAAPAPATSAPKEEAAAPESAPAPAASAPKEEAAAPESAPAPAASAPKEEAAAPESAPAHEDGMANPAKAPVYKPQSWSWEGIFGRYDHEQLRRGFQVYQQVCSTCHNLNHLHFRDLEMIGYTKDQVKEIAANWPNHVTDGPNDNGEMFERPPVPADRFEGPYKNNEQAKQANGGGVPVDLSMVTKARKDGPNYVFNLQEGFPSDMPGEVPQWYIDQEARAFRAANGGKEPDAPPTIPEDKYFNNWFPGHAISMPPQHLGDGMVHYEGVDEAPTHEQALKDVITFLNWASDPHLEERKSIGLKVIIFLGVLAMFLYALKVYIWRDVEH